MASQQLFNRYQELQRYVGWIDEDAQLVKALRPLVDAHLVELIDDFYDEIDRHPNARKVITGGTQQIERLKGTLSEWLRELLSGQYDADYVQRRSRVGDRHVQIGLDQVYTNVALSRLRTGLVRIVQEAWDGTNRSSAELKATIRSLNKLLDLDLAIIEDAYQAAHVRQQQQAERLIAIGQVAAGVAHELRNPLNVIKTSVYFLLNARNPSPEKTKEHLSRIERQVGLADGVITTLSNFARMPLPNLQPFQVKSFFENVLETSIIPAHIDVTVNCDETLSPVLGDADQLRIVISNLVRNAVDAMPSSGQLTIAAVEQDEHIELSVSDTGHGIEPENLERIMEPLYSTKARGIGLGLSMARAIVNKNHGRLSVKSTPGSGSTFTVRLAAQRAISNGPDPAE